MAVLVVGLLTVPQYGITSDEPVIFLGGEWNLWALGADDPGRWKLRESLPREFERLTNWSFHPDAVGHWAFPGFPGFFCTLVAQVARKLPGYDVVDAFHAGIVLLHALAVFAFAVYLARLLGTRRALLIAALYALYPCAVGHSHYNVKDWPMVGFYALTLVSFACGLVEDRPRFLLQSGFWLGLGICSKGNLLFTGPTLAIWAPIAWVLLYRKQRRPSRATIVALLTLPVVAAVTFWAVWPYLHVGTIGEQATKIGDVFGYILERGRSGREGFSAYSFFHIATMTPPIELMGLALAAVLPFQSGRRDSAIAALGWVWLLVPVVRIALPHSNYYDANRHFLEYIPALALLAGMGLDGGLQRLGRLVERSRLPGRTAVVPAGLALVVGLAAWPVVQYHPYETTYYNAFVGGLGGAQRRQLSWHFCEGMEFWCPDSEGDYWGFSFKNAVREVNRVAEPGAKLHPCGNLIGPLTRWQPVRKDMRIVGRNEADWFIVIPRRPFCSEGDRRYIAQNAEVVHEERRDGGLIFGIYRRR
ncbi:MAG: glycosyltransferase family 39 protein [Deltaproteobacteria bacterium]|nr:glycosyltransferase family 39 protein [Deltaproteobacteria bacterium]